MKIKIIHYDFPIYIYFEKRIIEIIFDTDLKIWKFRISNSWKFGEFGEVFYLSSIYRRNFYDIIKSKSELFIIKITEFK